MLMRQLTLTPRLLLPLDAAPCATICALLSADDTMRAVFAAGHAFSRMPLMPVFL